MIFSPFLSVVLLVILCRAVGYLGRFIKITNRRTTCPQGVVL